MADEFNSFLDDLDRAGAFQEFDLDPNSPAIPD